MSEEAPAPAPTPTPAPAPVPAERKGSPVARALLLAYAMLIVYASWFPFSGWQNQGLSPFIFLETTRLPRYWTGFDVGINVIGYAPFGMLLVYAMRPKVTGFWAFLLASLAGMLVSGTMEAVQTYLPTRVSSNLDFYTNTLGSVIGAFIGVLTAHTLTNSNAYKLRQQWFAQHASQGMVLAALWPLTQIYPQGFLFGLGQLLPILSEWLSELLDMEIDLAGMIRPDVSLTVEQYWLSETIVTACGMVGAALTLLCILRKPAPRAPLVALLVGAAVLVKSLSTALQLGPDAAFAWVTPGAQAGFLIGVIMLGGLIFAPQVAQRRLAVATLLLSLLIVNTTPTNPYFSETLQNWAQGKFLNFYGAAQFLSLAWPLAALWYLCLPSHKLNKETRETPVK